MNSVINLIVLFIVLLFSGVFYITSVEDEEQQDKEILFGCGTSYLDGTDTSSGRYGKTLFRNYCASCHDKSMKKNMTGPALAPVIRQWDSSSLKSYLADPEKFRQTKPDGLHTGLTGEIAHTAFPNLSMQEVDDLLAYIER
ncbi:cytochrome c [Saprospiraceae bacterium]|nr:cytochrome c [Saprospiraceae bacterium]